jgi:hypothetical protein
MPITIQLAFAKVFHPYHGLHGYHPDGQLFFGHFQAEYGHRPILGHLLGYVQARAVFPMLDRGSYD